MVDAKEHDVIGILIGRQQPRAGPIKRKIARRLALGRNPFDKPRRALGVIHREHSNAVIPAIGSLNKFSRRVNLDFGGGTLV